MVKDPFVYTEKDLYQLALKQGEKRFEAVCKHKRVRQGRCLTCFRRVYKPLPQ